MPWPLSDTRISIPASTAFVSTTTRPPSGQASIALEIKLWTTRLIFAGKQFVSGNRGQARLERYSDGHRRGSASGGRSC